MVGQVIEGKQRVGRYAAVGGQVRKRGHKRWETLMSEQRGWGRKGARQLLSTERVIK